MRFQRAVLVLFCASVALAAEPPELRPLKGEKFKGDLVEVNDKEIVLQVNGKPVATPLDGVLQLEFRAPVNPNGAYSQVELADGSILRCPKVDFKKKDAILTLFSGETVTVPMTQLTSVLHEANDVKLLASWRELVGGSKRAFDLLAVKKPDGTFAFKEGTFYEADATGDKIEFKGKSDDETKTYGLSKLSGLYFNRKPDPNMPRRRCEVIDLQGAKLYAKSVSFKSGKFIVETQCGVSVPYAVDALAKLDYNRGKLTYLSDIALASVDVKQPKAEGDKYMPEFRRDQNPDKTGPMRLAGKQYDKGLAIHSVTIATFNLEGDYREFSAVAGIDDNYSQGSEDPVMVRIEADGKELLTLQVTKKDGPKPINLNIKDVQKLRITVDHSPENIVGLGSCVDLADARVSK